MDLKCSAVVVALGARVALVSLRLDRLGEKEKVLRERYAGDSDAGAREIIAWLDGGYRITDEIVQTQ